MIQLHQEDTKNTKILLLILGGILLIIVAVVAGRVLVGSKSGEDSANVPTQNVQKDAPNILPAKKGSSVTGFISGITEDSHGKWIDVVVNESKPSEAPKPGEEPVQAPLETKKYKFLLSPKDTVGAKGIKGGEFATITFQGDPSEKDYMLADKVEKVSTKDLK